MSKAVALEFTEEEETTFQTCYENSYDIEDDAWYGQWLAKFHPEAATSVEILQCKSTAVNSSFRYLHLQPGVKHLSLSYAVEY